MPWCSDSHRRPPARKTRNVSGFVEREHPRLHESRHVSRVVDVEMGQEKRVERFEFARRSRRAARMLPGPALTSRRALPSR